MYPLRVYVYCYAYIMLYEHYFGKLYMHFISCSKRSRADDDVVRERRVFPPTSLSSLSSDVSAPDKGALWAHAACRASSQGDEHMKHTA
jgi:hypothetical protein